MKKLFILLSGFSLFCFASYSQNVGIGTTSPNNRLHVEGGAVQINGAANPPPSLTDAIQISFEGAAYGRIQTWNAKPLVLNPLGSNVGIGTTSPDAELEVRSSGLDVFRITEADGPPRTWRFGFNGSNGNLVTQSNFDEWNIYLDTDGSPAITDFFRIWRGAGPTGSPTKMLEVRGDGQTYISGNVGIGTTSPGASSLLDLSSTTKGFVLPRMTKAQRNAIASPVAGMAVYQTDNTPGLRVYDGTNWMRFTETAD